MNKKLTFLILFLILLPATSYITLINLNKILAYKVENLIKVPTYIQSVSINKDYIEIKEIILNNLPDSVLPTALKIENMIIDAPITTYLSDEIKLSSIICKDFFVGLEFESKGSSQGNWSILMDNINQSAPSDNSSKKSVFAILANALTTRTKSLQKGSSFNASASVMSKSFSSVLGTYT